MNAKIGISIVETMLKVAEQATQRGDSFSAKKAAETAYRKAIELFEAYENDDLAIDESEERLMSQWAERLGAFLTDNVE